MKKYKLKPIVNIQTRKMQSRKKNGYLLAIFFVHLTNLDVGEGHETLDIN